eukprot:7488088-Pyramimonas_sp.AAC.1
MASPSPSQPLVGLDRSLCSVLLPTDEWNARPTVEFTPSAGEFAGEGGVRQLQGDDPAHHLAERRGA